MKRMREKKNNQTKAAESCTEDAGRVEDRLGLQASENLSPADRLLYCGWKELD